jgi:hypothetical protein
MCKSRDEAFQTRKSKKIINLAAPNLCHIEKINKRNN